MRFWFWGKTDLSDLLFIFCDQSPTETRLSESRAKAAVIHSPSIRGVVILLSPASSQSSSIESFILNSFRLHRKLQKTDHNAQQPLLKLSHFPNTVRTILINTLNLISIIYYPPSCPPVFIAPRPNWTCTARYRRI
jgi:flagellar biosynthesis protein FlhB